MSNGLDLIKLTCTNNSQTFSVLIRRRELDHIKSAIKTLEDFPIDIGEMIVYPESLEYVEYNTEKYLFALRVHTYSRLVIAMLIPFNWESRLTDAEEYKTIIDDNEEYQWNAIN